MTVAKQPGHRGEPDISRKTIACGNAGRSGVLVVTRVRSTTTIAHETAGASGTRHSPRPCLGREINANLGRIAPRDRDVIFGADTVIPGRCQRVRATRGPMTGSASNPESRDSPMRNCASEVWSGARHRAAQGADPLGPSRNDGAAV